MNKIVGSMMLIMACSTLVQAEDSRSTASAPAAENNSTQRSVASNGNDAFCTAGTPCEVNRHRSGEYH